jgi:hypothetical protein
MDQQKLFALMSEFYGKMWPHATFSPDLIAIWAEMYKNENFEIFERAYKEAAKHSNGFPVTPAAVTNNLGVIRALLQPAKGTAAEAWSWILRVSAKGHNPTDKIEKPNVVPYLRSAWADMGGIKRLRRTHTQAELSALEREFTQLFNKGHEAFKVKMSLEGRAIVTLPSEQRLALGGQKRL